MKKALKDAKDKLARNIKPSLVWVTEWIKDLKKPRASVVLLALGITITLSLLRELAGIETSIVAGLMAGLFGYYAAETMLQPKKERKDRLVKLGLFLFNNWATAGWALLVYLFYSAGTIGETPIATDPLVKNIYFAVRHYGLIFIPLYIMTIAVFRLSIYGPGYSLFGEFDLVAKYIRSMLAGLAYYSIALWAIAVHGDSIKSYIDMHPTESLAVAIASFIIFIIIKLSPSLNSSGSYSSGSYSSGSYSSGSYPAATAAFREYHGTTDRDKKYIAAYIVSQVIVHKALGPLPSDFSCCINDKPGLDGNLGRVSLARKTHRLTEKTYAEWTMLLDLAGKWGEEYICHESTSCNGEDYQRWMSTAQKYLANHHKGIFYVPPVSELEQSQNVEKLEALKISHKNILTELYAKNEEVMTELLQTLLAKKEMNAAELTPYLSKVCLPKDFPLPAIHENIQGEAE